MSLTCFIRKSVCRSSDSHVVAGSGDCGGAGVASTSACVLVLVVLVLLLLLLFNVTCFLVPS